jgi:O-antigen/teichoic acid export membrane protein
MNRKRLTNLSKSGALFSARMAGAGLMFLVQAAIARWWGSDVLADYLLLISAANIAAMVMPLGFQTIGSYFAVEYASHGRAGDLMRFVKRAYLQAGTSAMAFAVAAWVIMQWTGLDGTIASLIVPGLLFAMAMASVFICSALLVGLKHPAAGLLADGLFRPLAVLAGFLLAIWIGEGARLDIMVWVMALAYTAVAAASLAWTLKAVSAVDDTHAPDAAQPRRWWRFALPWVIIATSTEFFFDIDLLMLASLLDKTELAIFGVSATVLRPAGVRDDGCLCAASARHDAGRRQEAGRRIRPLPERGQPCSVHDVAGVAGQHRSLPEPGGWRCSDPSSSRAGGRCRSSAPFWWCARSLALLNWCCP